MHVRVASARAVAAWLLATIVCLGTGATVAGAAPRQPAQGAHPARVSWDRTVLTVRGKTLHWRRVPGVSRYIVAVIIAGHRPAYRVVQGVTFTPRAVSRQTVSYRVRANLRRAPWTRPVSIAYALTNGRRQSDAPQTAATPQVGPGGLQPGTSSSAGQPLPTPSTDKLKVGVMDLGNYNYAPFYSASLFGHAGVAYTREDVDRGQDTGTCDAIDYVCTAVRNGITPLVLFEGYADGNMPAEVVSLAQKLSKLAVSYPILNKLPVIEFGNEVWWGTSGPAENAATYGHQYNAAHAALAAAGLGAWKLLAVGNGLGSCVNSYTSPSWINQVIAAQSSGAAGVDGWTVHPYGPMTTDFGCGAAGQGYGWPEVLDYHNIAVKAGSNAPWYVTEVGQCLGGSGCNAPVPMGTSSDMPQGSGSAPYYTQAADLRQYLTDAGGDARTGTAARYPWIAALIFYQAYDDSSGWFGLASNGTNLGQPTNYQRPAMTQLQQWITANGEG